MHFFKNLICTIACNDCNDSEKTQGLKVISPLTLNENNSFSLVIFHRSKVNSNNEVSTFFKQVIFFLHF